MPPLTPLEVIETFPDVHRTYVTSYLKVYYDGPQMSPPELWSPTVVLDDETVYMVSGDVGDPITAYSEWIQCPI